MGDIIPGVNMGIDPKLTEVLGENTGIAMNGCRDGDIPGLVGREPCIIPGDWPKARAVAVTTASTGPSKRIDTLGRRFFMTALRVGPGARVFRTIDRWAILGRQRSSGYGAGTLQYKVMRTACQRRDRNSGGRVPGAGVY